MDRSRKRRPQQMPQLPPNQPRTGRRMNNTSVDRLKAEEGKIFELLHDAVCKVPRPMETKLRVVPVNDTAKQNDLRPERSNRPPSHGGQSTEDLSYVVNAVEV